MCIGIPMQLVSMDGSIGVVEEGGVRHQISLALLEDAEVGQYVLIHAGYAISQLDAEEANETLELLQAAGFITIHDEDDDATVPPDAEGTS